MASITTDDISPIVIQSAPDSEAKYEKRILYSNIVTAVNKGQYIKILFEQNPKNGHSIDNKGSLKRCIEILSPHIVKFSKDCRENNRKIIFQFDDSERLVDQRYGHCLDATNGKKITLEVCNDILEQKWEISKDFSKGFGVKIKNKKSNQCLTYTDGGSKSNLSVINCLAHSRVTGHVELINLDFALKHPSNFFQIQAGNGKCIQADHSKSYLRECNEQNRYQIFQFDDTNGKTVLITNNGNECLSGNWWYNVATFNCQDDDVGVTIVNFEDYVILRLFYYDQSISFDKESLKLSYKEFNPNDVEQQFTLLVQERN